MSDWNHGIIEEFRANEGRVGGPFAGAPLLLLHTIGAKSGQERVNPMMYQDLGEGRLAVFASYAGLDVNPAWFHNLCLLYTSPSPRDGLLSRMPSSA